MKNWGRWADRRARCPSLCVEVRCGGKVGFCVVFSCTFVVVIEQGGGSVYDRTVFTVGLVLSFTQQLVMRPRFIAARTHDEQPSNDRQRVLE